MWHTFIKSKPNIWMEEVTFTKWAIFTYIWQSWQSLLQYASPLFIISWLHTAHSFIRIYFETNLSQKYFLCWFALMVLKTGILSSSPGGSLFFIWYIVCASKSGKISEECINHHQVHFVSCRIRCAGSRKPWKCRAVGLQNWSWEATHWKKIWLTCAICMAWLLFRSHILAVLSQEAVKTLLPSC